MEENEKNEFEEFLNKQEEAYKKGKLMCYVGMGEVGVADIEKLCEQFTDGLLYDINRDEITVRTVFPQNLIVNEIATIKLLRWLHGKYKELKKENEELKSKFNESNNNQ